MITREIGEGGMGAVLLAEDQLLKRSVVMKALLSEDDPDLIAQSIKEREFLAAIKHANIVSIYDFIAQGQRGYIVMEYVQGKTLDQIMQEQGRPFDVPEAIASIQSVLPAFIYLAKLGLVYCDFKPQNVMLEMLKDGSRVVKLVDLGTVIKYEPRPPDVYGTHGFYAPEAVKSPSPETDLYSICRTLAFLVTDMDLARPVFGLPSIEAYQAFREYPISLTGQGDTYQPTAAFSQRRATGRSTGRRSAADCRGPVRPAAQFTALHLRDAHHYGQTGLALRGRPGGERSGAQPVAGR
jgi:serine/threonine-protein kinase PknG